VTSVITCSSILKTKTVFKIFSSWVFVALVVSGSEEFGPYFIAVGLTPARRQFPAPIDHFQDFTICLKIYFLLKYFSLENNVFTRCNVFSTWSSSYHSSSSLSSSSSSSPSCFIFQGRDKGYYVPPETLGVLPKDPEGRGRYVIPRSQA
jgi:hypothetical protein